MPVHWGHVRELNTGNKSRNEYTYSFSKQCCVLHGLFNFITDVELGGMRAFRQYNINRENSSELQKKNLKLLLKH